MDESDIQKLFEMIRELDTSELVIGADEGWYHFEFLTTEDMESIVEVCRKIQAFLNEVDSHAA